MGVNNPLAVPTLVLVIQPTKITIYRRSTTTSGLYMDVLTCSMPPPTGELEPCVNHSQLCINQEFDLFLSTAMLIGVQPENRYASTRWYLWKKVYKALTFFLVHCTQLYLPILALPLNKNWYRWKSNFGFSDLSGWRARLINPGTRTWRTSKPYHKYGLTL